MKNAVKVSAVAVIAHAGAAPRRLASCAAAAIAGAGLIAVTGCSAASSGAARPAVTVTATVTAGSSVTATAPPATVPPPATTATQPASSAAAPVLGQLAGAFAHGAGFGQVKPSRIFNGGDPTGLVTGISWASWGGAQATGTGTSDYVGPSQSDATGTQEPVTVVAFRLGSCDGKLMYRAVEWYFSQHGQAFNPRKYQNVCAGSFVPAS
jgi:hypothetical protein